MLILKNMLARFLISISLLSLGLLSLVFLALSKDPLCIDSTIVESIDIQLQDRTQSVFRCSLRREVPFSEYFFNRQNDFNRRFKKVYRLLESMKPLRQRINLNISTLEPLQFTVKGSKVVLGSDLVEREGVLEKALFKVWFREQMISGNLENELSEEVITDFLVYLVLGKLPDEQDGADRPLRWSQIIKSMSSYCESNWVTPEDLNICAGAEGEDWGLKDQLHVMNLRPVLTSSWVLAYLRLPANERYFFVSELPNLIKKLNKEIPSIKGSFEKVSDFQAANRKIVGFKKDLAGSLEANSKFSEYLEYELKSFGFKEDTDSAFFDVLFVSLKSLDERSPLIHSLRKLALAHPRIQIAVKSADRLWLMPEKTPIDQDQFGQIRAHRTVVEKCGLYDFNFVLEYSNLTDKLLVVNRCQDQHEAAYGGFLSEGIERFAQQNKSFSFVQFHLPSLLMKKSDLLTAGNVVELLRDQDNRLGSYQKLGWHSIQWNQKANFYEPESYNEAIQSFRLIN